MLSLFEKHSITGGCCVESGEAGDGNCERKTSQNWKEDVGSGSPTTSLLAGSPPTPELGLRLACLTQGLQRALCTQMCEAPRPPQPTFLSVALGQENRLQPSPAGSVAAPFCSRPLLSSSQVRRPGEPASWGAGAPCHFYSASTDSCSPPLPDFLALPFTLRFPWF